VKTYSQLRVHPHHIDPRHQGGAVPRSRQLELHHAMVALAMASLQLFPCDAMVSPSATQRSGD